VVKKRAVVLLSGGLDSATTLAMACAQGFECYALTCVYGQRHSIEIENAKKVAHALGVKLHREMTIDLALFGGSALTDPDLSVPKDRSEEAISTHIPVTYVPARNTVFLSLALAWAEALGGYDLFVGVNAMDYSGYPDCRKEFIEAFENTANLATAAAVAGKGRFRIHTPIIAMTKSQIILEGTRLGLDYGLTHSCYDPDDQGRSCAHCDSCQIRLKGFEQAGLVDPVAYQDS
jgi:7-cyano-7-deazaguanine synthase